MDTITVLLALVIILAFAGLFLLRKKTITDLDINTALSNALKESERKYHELVETAKNVTLQTDSDGRIVFASSAMRLVFCHDPEHCLGLEWFELIHPKQRNQLRRNFTRWKNFATKTHERYECQVIGCNGTLINMLWNVSIIYKEDRFIGLNIVGTDITREKKLQAELKESREAYRILADNYQRFMEEAVVDDPRLNSSIPTSNRAI